MASQWFCKVLGQELGPVSFREMAEMARAGTLKEDDPVRREGTSQWTRAGEVIGLFRAAAKERPQAPPQAKAEPQPAQAPSQTKEAQPPPTGPQRIGLRQVFLAGGLVVGLLLLVVAVSAWRANRRERFPEPSQAPPPVVQPDLLGSLVANRSSTASSPVPDGPVPEPVSADASPLKARLTLDFREGFETQLIELVGGSPPDQHFAIEPGGLRITVPDDSDVDYFAADVKVRVKGDFRITARYVILNMPPPQGGFGSGVSLWVEDAQGERAAVERRHREREGHVFGSYRGRCQQDGTYLHSAPLRETSSEALSGWLRLARVGKEIRYQVAGPHVERFTQIHEEEFTDDEVVRVRVVVQTGGSSTGVDAICSYFDVQAEEVVKTY